MIVKPIRSNTFLPQKKHNPPFIYMCLDAGLSHFEVEKCWSVL